MLKFRFSLKLLLVALTMLSLLMAVPINRAYEQQSAVAEIYDCGGFVYFENEPPRDFPLEEQRYRETSLMHHLRWCVSEVEFDFYHYSPEMKVAISKLKTLRTIRLIGHDSAFGAARVSDEFSQHEIVDVPAERSKRTMESIWF